ncbi:hypothetical protein [Magnetospirillum fulvum]|uniref:hypothetical protein n=1 Tax=Magnetospirillum fulvum TaxID=1082 RepID=UPI0012DD28C5|nr:hypothetical protein [Magnetospirillum fulvum]
MIDPTMAMKTGELVASLQVAVGTLANQLIAPRPPVPSEKSPSSDRRLVSAVQVYVLAIRSKPTSLQAVPSAGAMAWCRDRGGRRRGSG